MAKKQKKPKKPKVVPIKKQIKKMMGLVKGALSKYIREYTRRKYNGLCPLCGVGPLIPRPPKKITLKHPETHESAVQCCFHFVRSKFCKALRFEVRNVIGACHKCNWVEYRNPDPSRAWYIREYGHEAYLQLVDDSKQEFEYTLEYLTPLYEKYTRMYNELTAVTDPGSDRLPPS